MIAVQIIFLVLAAIVFVLAGCIAAMLREEPAILHRGMLIVLARCLGVGVAALLTAAFAATGDDRLLVLAAALSVASFLVPNPFRKVS